MDTMEAPPNLNATAQPIESNENKMSCRVATSPRQLICAKTQRCSPESIRVLENVSVAHASGVLVSTS